MTSPRDGERRDTAAAASPAAAPITTSAEDVVEAIHAVMHRFRARQYRAVRADEGAPSHMEAKALGYFARHPGATQSDLVQHAGRDKGQVARLIAGLRARGLLDAEADSADRRAVRLRVSAAGEALQRALQAQAAALADEALHGLDEAERRQLAALLARLQRNLADD